MTPENVAFCQGCAYGAAISAIICAVGLIMYWIETRSRIGFD